MPDKPNSVLQYIHRSNRIIGHTLLRIDSHAARQIETAEKIAEMERGLETARRALARCRTFMC